MIPSLKGIPIPRVLYHEDGLISKLAICKNKDLLKELRNYLNKNIDDDRIFLLDCRRRVAEKCQVAAVEVPFSGDNDEDNPAINMPQAYYRQDYDAPIKYKPTPENDRDQINEQFGEKLAEIFEKHITMAAYGWNHSTPRQGEVEWHLARDTIYVSCDYVEEEMQDCESGIGENYNLDILQICEPPKNITDPYLEILKGVKASSLTKETLEIIEVVTSSQKRFSEFLLKLPDIKEIPCSTLKEEFSYLGQKANPLVPLAWHTEDSEIHACWNLFLPMLPDFWTEKPSIPVNVYAIAQSYEGHKMHGDDSCNIQIPPMQTLAYARLVIMYSLIIAPLLQWKSMEEYNRAAVTGYIHDEIKRVAPILHRNIKKICKDVIKSLEITPEMCRHPQLGVLDIARMQKKLRQENTIESKKILDACNGSSAVLSMVLDARKDAVVREWSNDAWDYERVMDSPYRRSLFTHSKIQGKSAESIRKIIRNDADPEETLHKLIFGNQACRDTSKTKRRKLLKAIPSFRDRWRATWIEYPLSVPRASIYKNVTENRIRDVQRHYQETLFMMCRSLNDITEPAMFQEQFAAALELPQEYIPENFAECCEWFMIYRRMEQFHLHHNYDMGHDSLHVQPKIQKIWMEYLRSHRKGNPRWETVQEVGSDIYEASEAFRAVYHDAIVMAFRKGKSPTKASIMYIRKYLKEKITNLSPSRISRIRQRYSRHAPALNRIELNLALVPEGHATKFLSEARTTKNFTIEDLTEFERREVDLNTDLTWPKALVKEIKLDNGKMAIYELADQHSVVRNGEILGHCIGKYVRSCINEDNCRILEMYQVEDNHPIATAQVMEHKSGVFNLSECRRRNNMVCSEAIQNHFQKAVDAMNKYWKSRRSELNKQRSVRKECRILYLKKYQQSPNDTDTLPLAIRKYGACQKWPIYKAILEDLPEPYLNTDT